MASFYRRPESKSGYRKDCIDCVQSRVVRYHILHKDEISEYQRAYSAENAQAKREAARLWNEQNPGRVQQRVAEWRRNNPDRHNDWNAKRRASQRAVHVEDVDRQIVFARDIGICGLCHLPVSPRGWHLDHVIPLTRDGEHSYANTRVTHSACNSWKNDRLDSELPPIPPRILKAAQAEADLALAA